MRLVTFQTSGQIHIGALLDEHALIDINHACPDLPTDMAAFLAIGGAAIAQTGAALAAARSADILALGSVTLLAPVPRPGKILCVGHNYKDHIGIGRTDLPEYPNLFSKTTNAVIGSGQPIVVPHVTRQVDYEGELAVVIGKRGRNVPEAEAMQHVAGYTVFNDVSARDYQKRGSQWMLGKSFDTFAPFGPVLVTTDEIPDPHCLELELTVNGIPCQRANTGDQIFSVRFLVSYLSTVMTLEPGDVIATGTPAKLPEAAGAARFLQPGDVVEVSIEKIGRLINPVVAETNALSKGDTDMKYHAILGASPGLNPPPYNPCTLLDFALLKLEAGKTHAGESGGREILAVLLGGRASFEVRGQALEKVGGRPNVFGGKPHSVYIPAGCAYSIRAESALEVALCSAPSDLKTDPYVIAPSQVANGTWGAANFKRYYHQILTLASQPELPARRLIAGETFTPSGNWSTYPPHKHQVDDLPREAYHEEMYYFRVSPADGFGICHYYNEEGEEENFTVRDNSLHMMPRGYHTVVSAPGYTTYYLWFLAGNQRAQGALDDPAVGWVNKTVAMLKELGH